MTETFNDFIDKHINACTYQPSKEFYMKIKRLHNIELKEKGKIISDYKKEINKLNFIIKCEK